METIGSIIAVGILISLPILLVGDVSTAIIALVGITSLLILLYGAKRLKDLADEDSSDAPAAKLEVSASVSLGDALDDDDDDDDDDLRGTSPHETGPGNSLRDRLSWLVDNRWSGIVANAVTHPRYTDVAGLGSKISVLSGRLLALIDFRARNKQTDRATEVALETIIKRLEETLAAWGAVFELRQNTATDDQALLTILSDADAVVNIVERDIAQPHRDSLDLQKRLAVFEADLRRLSTLPQPDLQG